MVEPVGCDVDKVNIIALAELLVSLGAYVALRLGHTLTLQHLLTLVHIALLKVAKALDFNTLKVCEALNSTRAAHTQADKTYAYNGNRIGGKAQHRLLTSSACRLNEVDHTIFHLVVIASDSCSLATTATLQHYTHQKGCAENE